MKAPEDELWPFLAELTLDGLPSATRQTTSALVLDHLTCAVVGMDLSWTRCVRRMFTELDSVPPGAPGHLGPAFRYGSDRPLSTPTAALVNGTAVHGLDFDDLYLPAMTHPAAVVIPAAVAVATALGAPGDRLLAAVAAGYECMGRVGRAVGVRNIDHGFHGTGQQGPLGAAVAVGKLLGFDAAGLENAVALAASFGGGIKAFTEGPGMVKRLHAGRAAQAGVLAAHATLRGFAGPRRPLSSAFGFVHVFALGGPEHPEALNEGIGESFVVDDVYLKPYAACGAVHGALVAAEMVAANAREDGVRLVPEEIEEVEEVVVGSSKRAGEQNSDPDPRDVMSAQYSMEYAVALALLGQARDATRFLAAESGEDASVRRLAGRIRLRVDERAQAAYPASNEGHVRLRLRDGRDFAAHGAATSAASRGWAVAEDKFRQSTRALLPAEAASAVLSGVRELAGGGSVDGFLDPLVGRVAADAEGIDAGAVSGQTV